LDFGVKNLWLFEDSVKFVGWKFVSLDFLLNQL